MRRILGGAIALAIAVAWPGEAAAQWAAGADVSGILPGGAKEWGAAADLRFGLRFGLPRAFIIHTVILQPELIAGYRRLPPWDADVPAYRLGGGGRIGAMLGYLEPFAVGHFSAVDGSGNWGYLWDVGAALDFRFTGSSLGAHWTHDWLRVDGALGQFNEVGLHFEFRWF
jgi:hypothetical protein